MKIREILNENQVNLLKVVTPDINGEPYVLYTATDGNGNFPLDNGGGVFFADDPKNPYIRNLDGKPHSSSEEIGIFDINGDIGLYDDNMQRVSDEKFQDFEDAIEAYQEHTGEQYNP